MEGQSIDYRGLVEYIIKAFATEPDQVTVSASERRRTVNIEVGVSAKDRGALMGRRGQNIEAIRAFLQAVGIKDRKRIRLKVR
jgi:predicted RNA-binding protein YlqC (UPF0109 family)